MAFAPLLLFSCATCHHSHTSYLCRMKALKHRTLKVSGVYVSPYPPKCTGRRKRHLTPGLASRSELLLIRKAEVLVQLCVFAKRKMDLKIIFC